MVKKLPILLQIVFQVLELDHFKSMSLIELKTNQNLTVMEIPLCHSLTLLST